MYLLAQVGWSKHKYLLHESSGKPLDRYSWCNEVNLRVVGYNEDIRPGKSFVVFVVLSGEKHG